MNLKYTPNTLKKLEQLFEEAGYRIRYEKGHFNSGFCVLEDKKVAVINRFLDIEGRIHAIVEIVATLKINEKELSGEMQKWYWQVLELNGGSKPHSVQTQLDL
jgi:hypothetical protein